MDDIEDLGARLKDDGIVPETVRSRRQLTIRSKRGLKESIDEPRRLQQAPETVPEAALPGLGKIWVKTWGCSHNVSDTEYMMGMLSQYGFEVVEGEEKKHDADLWLLNSCTVKDPSQAAFVNLLKSGRQANPPKPLVLAGCVPQGDRSLKELDGIGEGVSLVGVAQLERIVEVVERTLRGECVRVLGKKAGQLPSLTLPKVRRNAMVEIVPLSTGCLGACTYCKTRHARGKLGSYSVEDIVARIRAAISEGVTEVWLSSEDTGAYGIDLGTNLTMLLKRVTKLLEGSDVMLRLGMTNPPYILDQLEAVAEALRHPNVYSFLHVPVQSGSDAVLSAMNREYTVAEFRQVVNGLRSTVPVSARMLDALDLTLATDVICGFPGESHKDFDDTMALVQDFQFPVLNISQFYARPGTPAAKMRRVPNGVAKDRSRRISQFFNENQDPHKALLGTVVDVWTNTEVSATGKDEAQCPVGHTKSYVKVLLDTMDGAVAGTPLVEKLIGVRAKVRVTSTHRWHVTGHVLECCPVRQPPQILTNPVSYAKEASAEVDLSSKEQPGVTATGVNWSKQKEGSARDQALLKPGDRGVGLRGSIWPVLLVCVLSMLVLISHLSPLPVVTQFLR